MEHYMHATILACVLVAVIVGIAFVSSVQFISEPGGFFRISARSEPTQTDVCYDTDGGANWFVRGAVSYQNWSFVDDCSIIVVENTMQTTLYEGYCADPTTPTLVQHNCTYGCVDGACLQS